MLLMLAFAPCALAESFGRLRVTKRIGYEQLDPVTVRPVEWSYELSLIVTGPAASRQPPVEVPVTAPNGATLWLRREGASYSLLGSAPDEAALHALVPDGEYKLGLHAFFETPVTPPFTLVAAGQEAPLITNFTALQSWSGYGATVTWKPIPDGTTDSALNVSVRAPDDVFSRWSNLGFLNGTSTSAVLHPFVAMDRVLEGTLFFNGAAGRQFTLRFPLQVFGHVVVTYAGQPNLPGSVDGPRHLARLTPHALACDASGNVFFTELSCVRKIGPDGQVTTLAGHQDPNFRDDIEGTGINARFFSLGGLAVDLQGNLYVSDNQKIKKISPAGVVTRLAGPPATSGILTGYVDGPADQARFHFPGPLAVDDAGNVYVIDFGQVVRKVSPQGTVSTLAGARESGYVDGPGAQARFGNLVGIAAAPDGTVYLTDSINRTIRKISPDGIVSSLTDPASPFDPGVDDIGPVRRIEGAGQLSLDRDGNLYYIDDVSNVVRRISPDRKIRTMAGSGSDALVDGMGANASFKELRGIAVDGSGNIYVADVGCIRKIVVTASAAMPRVIRHPTGRQIEPGRTVVFTATGRGEGLSYQWRFNDTPIAGETTPTLVIRDAPGTADGNYSLEISTPFERAVSAPARLVVAPSSAPARIANLSVRADTGSGGNTLIMGFVIDGAGASTAKTILLRGTGPALANFGVSNHVGDPSLTLFAGLSSIAANDDWDGSVATIEAAARLGAFALVPGSKDAVLFRDAVAAGSYSAHVTSQAGNGIALAEVYDASTSSATGPRLVNVSARAAVGGGASSLTTGFITAGDRDTTVLIRAIGPALAAHGVSDPLRDPRLTLYRSTAEVGANDNWESAGPAADMMGAVGAFPLAADSRDAVILVTLSPGAYTAVVSAADGGSGVALLEVYEVK
jgi:sugar lactone lactonase YvrE